MLLVLCMLLVVHYCKGQSGVIMTNFDFPSGYQNNILKNKEKNVNFALLLKIGLYSGYLLIFSRRTTVPVFNRWHFTGKYS